MASKCRKCGNTDNYNFALNIGLCDICIGERIEELEAQLEQHRWIPVNERLPEDEKDYLVWCYGEIGLPRPACEFCESITHWKPIILP